MSKIRIDKEDYARILLTEVLPYEVPIPFTNEGFYRYASSNQSAHALCSEILAPRGETIPYDYSIRKSSTQARTLTVIHPAIQREFMDFYKAYDSLIVDLCRRSPFTLRAPFRIASRYYQKPSIDNDAVKVEMGVETGSDDNIDDVKHASSYFLYKKFDFVYKFYESYQYHELEKKYSRLLMFDIAHCFPSIYTHSIAWSVKDKQYAKENKNANSFEQRFDELMRHANYGETNGIVVGPEVSRIFAEIVMQRIDCDVIKSLRASKDHPLANEIDYSVRRYVDDFFVFTNDLTTEERVSDAIRSEMGKYRLSVNEAKTQHMAVPFVTNITVGKIRLRELTNLLLSRLGSDLNTNRITLEKLDEENELRPTTSSAPLILRSPRRVAGAMILELKAEVKHQLVQYDSVSTTILIAARKWLRTELRRKNLKLLCKSDPMRVRAVLWVFLDVIFFIYAMDPRVRTTYIVSHILAILNEFVKGKAQVIADDIRKKILDESVKILRIARGAKVGLSVEVQNLILVLRELGNQYMIEEDALMRLLGMQGSKDRKVDMDVDYFQIVVLLYYTRSSRRYSLLRKKLSLMIVRKYRVNEPFKSAELTCLFFDLISCPYVHVSLKRRLASMAFVAVRRRKPPIADVNKFISQVSSHQWFVDWSPHLNVGMLLSKKELRPAYQ